MGKKHRIIISNRGEIARRILMTAKKRGYEVAVISTPLDRDSLVRKLADEVLEVESFLNIEEIIEVSKKWKGSMLHPGYGYLSENGEFARRVEEEGIAFVGPTEDNMKKLGNKEEARSLAERLKIPVLKGVLSRELNSMPENKWCDALKERGLDFPLMIKAAGGGGGKGMRVVEKSEDLVSLVKRASSEAESAFADGRVFLERLIKKPRHIEAQIVGDGEGNILFFGERECSLQRRHQKVIEETPSCVVTEEKREKIKEYATKLTSFVKYRSAGTVEFLMDEEGNFYFLEVNTRLQVEHPVTEMVYGIDLVDLQFEIAEGNGKVALEKSKDIKRKGWAIEARIIAEDPKKNFAPSPGKIIFYKEPEMDGVRIDSGVCEGSVVTTSFDSLLSKCIVYGKHREEAISKLALALKNYVLLGVTTNIPFLKKIVMLEDFQKGNFDTNFIERNLEKLKEIELDSLVRRALKNHSLLEKIVSTIDGKNQSSNADENVLKFTNSQDVFSYGKLLKADIEQIDKAKFKMKVYNEKETKIFEFYGVRTFSDEISIFMDGEVLEVKDPFAGRKLPLSGKSDGGEVRAPLAGKVVDCRVKTNDRVSEGELMFVVESMKMQLEVLAPISGVVKEIRAKVGEVLNGPDVLAVIEENGG